jgi:hypothetical protein
MRSKSYQRVILVPVLAYLGAVLLLAVFVVKPSALGWVGFGVLAAIGLLIGGFAAFLYPRMGTNTNRIHPRADGLFRLLVVADAHCESTPFCEAVRGTIAGRAAEVLVVAPVLASPLHYLTNAEDSEREDARVRLAETLQGLARFGIEARGVVGTDDPLQAIGDSLAGFPATEILLAAPEARQRTWLEHGLERQARDVSGVHVSSLTISVATAAAGQR